MKLYTTTTTSERASKGQGGNKNILVVLTAEIDGQRQEIASMSVDNNNLNDFYRLFFTLPDGYKKEVKISKGKK